MTNPLVSSAPNLGHSCLVFYFQIDTYSTSMYTNQHCCCLVATHTWVLQPEHAEKDKYILVVVVVVSNIKSNQTSPFITCNAGSDFALDGL